MSVVLDLPKRPTGRPMPAGEIHPLPARTKLPKPRSLRLGFVRLVDAAPLVAAAELGLFKQRGLNIELTRAIGWATLSHRAIFDGLDLAHAPGPLPLALTLGLGGLACPCVAGLVLNLHGNAITLSKHLRENGVKDGPSLATHIFSTHRRQPLTLAVVSRHSSHLYLLTRWLHQHGIDARRDVRVVVLPPEQLVRNLAAGNIDGFCAGEPWNSQAITEAGGWCPATSPELDFGHAEKVLMATEDFVARCPEEYTAIASAILEACAWCDSAEGRKQLPALLARPEYLDMAAEIISRSLQGPFDRGDGRSSTEANSLVFHRFRANEPTPEKALWMLDCLTRTETLTMPEKQLRDTALGVFRADLFRAAERQANSGDKSKNEPSK